MKRLVLRIRKYGWNIETVRTRFGSSHALCIGSDCWLLAFCSFEGRPCARWWGVERGTFLRLIWHGSSIFEAPPAESALQGLHWRGRSCPETKWKTNPAGTCRCLGPRIALFPSFTALCQALRWLAVFGRRGLVVKISSHICSLLGFFCWSVLDSLRQNSARRSPDTISMRSYIPEWNLANCNVVLHDISCSTSTALTRHIDIWENPRLKTACRCARGSRLWVSSKSPNRWHLAAAPSHVQSEGRSHVWQAMRTRAESHRLLRVVTWFCKSSGSSSRDRLGILGVVW